MRVDSYSRFFCMQMHVRKTISYIQKLPMSFFTEALAERLVPVISCK